MKIKEGVLVKARYIESPNHNKRDNDDDLSLIVLHNISLPPGKFGGEWITKLFTNTLPKDADPFFEEIYQLQVSSHLLIRRDGEIIQYVPFHKRAWHAGVSTYLGRSACNDFSVGIELEGTDYEAFTIEQYEVLSDVLHTLVKTYPTLTLDNITGHEHVAPVRKTDPGPFFDWETLGKKCGVTLPARANNESNESLDLE
jgi:AmpD protein